MLDKTCKLVMYALNRSLGRHPDLLRNKCKGYWLYQHGALEVDSTRNVTHIDLWMAEYIPSGTGVAIRRPYPLGQGELDVDAHESGREAL